MASRLTSPFAIGMKISRNHHMMSAPQGVGARLPSIRKQ